ncbi:hypothetical protein GCM10009715_08730 [Paeniglutamicibacter psychrophenolicus]|uniref:DUF4357 domain-containing protein n=1 Tax=Paeniglutamicibacter psychrophenolicus TaxID=257454 RepID=A0ABS4WFI6_9MICC|nr:hypothetical protein [Paeniglutamicibacter psychrophenolicus]MBP2374975.1 hypothetical protein [Paeniglutamicibacter psychrophenolicus]
MKIAFAVDLEHDPDFGHPAVGTPAIPIPFSLFLGSSPSVLPSAQRSFPAAGTTAALGVELWWIQGCCPVVTIDSTGTMAPQPPEKITRAELAETIESLLQGFGAGGMRLPAIFPLLPLAAPHPDGAPPAGRDGSLDWSDIFVDSPAPGEPAVSFSRIDAASPPHPEILRLGLEANVNRLARGLRSWAEGPAGGDEAEFTYWQVSGTALLHRITGSYVAVGTQVPAPGTALDVIGPLVVQLRRLHADATTVIPVLQQALAQQREGSLEEEREATQRQRRAEAEVRRAQDAALAQKEERIHKLRDRFDRQKSYAYGAVGLVISIIALVPTIGALHPDSLETPYGGQIAWIAASLPLLLTFAISFIILMRSRGNLTAELLRLTADHLETKQLASGAAPQQPIPGPRTATHELDSAGGLHAEALVLPDGTALVLKGSLAQARSHSSVSVRTNELRKELLSSGVLVAQPGSGYLAFAEDHAFVSLAAATRAIRAKAVSGPAWVRVGHHGRPPEGQTS